MDESATGTGLLVEKPDSLPEIFCEKELTSF
jgi:hypothetical protein